MKNKTLTEKELKEKLKQLKKQEKLECENFNYEEAARIRNAARNCKSEIEELKKAQQKGK